MLAAALTGLVPTMTHEKSGRSVTNKQTQKRMLGDIVTNLLSAFDLGRIEKELQDVWIKAERAKMNPLLLSTAQDMSNSQSLNNSNLDSINACEKIASGKGKFYRCKLPSSSALSRTNRKVESGFMFLFNYFMTWSLF
jgi:hypothetical protein